MPQLIRATPADIPALVRTQARAFDDDAARFGNSPEGGGPPGYDEPAWQLMMMGQRFVEYYTIQADGQVIGGAILILKGLTHIELGRIWIDPDHQGKGFGQVIMVALETLHPNAARWTLETPVWATRNHHFYTRCGYVQTGPHPAMADQVVFEKYREE